MASELNNAPPGTFPIDFGEVRHSFLDIGQLKELTVRTVAPTIPEIVNANRAKVRGDYACDIGIWQIVGPTDEDKTADKDARTRELLDLREAFLLYMAQRTLTDLPTASYINMPEQPVMDYEQWSENSLFVSRITIVYRVFRNTT